MPRRTRREVGLWDNAGQAFQALPKCLDPQHLAGPGPCPRVVSSSSLGSSLQGAWGAGTGQFTVKEGRRGRACCRDLLDPLRVPADLRKPGSRLGAVFLRLKGFILQQPRAAQIPRMKRCFGRRAGCAVTVWRWRSFLSACSLCVCTGTCVCMRGYTCLPGQCSPIT